jgi:hypothetical protein
MKKILLILAIALTGCTAEEMAVQSNCECVFDAIRYISFDDGQTWSFNSYDGRHGQTFECEFEKTYIQYYGNYSYKYEFKCR